MPVLRPLLSVAFLSHRPLLYHQIAAFHTTPVRLAGNFYQTLGLEHGASPASIKKQFYVLSKTHHPDHNPSDPQASERFVKISEAYDTLGSPEKRQHYDRDLFRARPSAHSPQTPRGSHSSASTPYGSRPASGLSRRRTQYKGPPPSFYRSGGWGAYGSRRQAQAEGAASAAAKAANASPGGSFGPGQGQTGFSNDVPHFDQDGHFRTQESHEQRWKSRRREDISGYNTGGADMILRFFLISGIVGLACLPIWAYGAGGPPPKLKERIASG